MPTPDRHPRGTPCWFDLMTPDPAAAADFYAAVFGWTSEDTGEEMGHYRMARIQGHAVAGIGQLPPDGGFPPSWTIYFAADDADTETAAAAAAGATVLVPPTDVGPEGRMSVIADPTGAVLGLWQPRDHKGAGLTDEPGCMTWCEVNTRDSAKAQAFYEGMFGLTGAPMAGMPYVTLSRPDRPVCGILQMDAQWGELPPHWMPYFAVADAAAAGAAVAGAGGQLMHGPFDTPFGKVAVCADPAGAWFSIIQLRPQG
jgi:predicted enzyme related to lactoylglutathione lyase